MVDKWLEMGVDGVRLDAVPYLFEREGTNCENLPETHEFLRELRAHVDERFPGRMLLAEANQWPEDSVAYFGGADAPECHTAFHFPLMPRLFMSLRMEDRFPVIDILQQTPEIPELAQWAIFLRNHDELTLEMVTDEERDYMYRAYAADPRMRVNVGIRRRLAPLMQNDRRKIELMNGLLFAMPGTPVLYYGDELGMGDNVYLGDRDSVRTPMQWSPDRNAGFSSANPQRLFLPVIIDPEYHYETVNVEAQQHNPSSLLWWMRRIIALRAQHKVFGRGDIQFLLPENAKVLAFTRSYEGETVLVVANLSRFAQSVTLDLHDHRGKVPVELAGGTEFAPIHEGGYNLTLGAYGFYWFSLQPQHHDALGHAPTPGDLPTLRVSREWRQLFHGRSRAREELHRAWPAFFERNRWYAGRSRTLRATEVIDAVPVSSGRGKPTAYVALVHAEYADGEPETYVVPVTVANFVDANQVLADHPNAPIAWVEVDSWPEPLLLFDATADDAFMDSAVHLFRRNRHFDSALGAELRTHTSPDLRRVLAHSAELAVARTSVEQSNTSAIFGNQVVMKLFRRAQEGVNPDLEIGRFLTERGFEHTAHLLGAVEYQRGRAEPRTLAVLNRYIPNEGDAWHYTLDALGLYYESALRMVADEEVSAPGWESVLELGGVAPPDAAADAIGPFLDSAEMLGRRTAELHAVLATGEGPQFRPEPFTSHYQRSLYQSMRGAGAAHAGAGAPHPGSLRGSRPRRRRAPPGRRVPDPRGVRAGAPAPHRGQPHPGARRLPPRPGAARRARLRDHRLRGRAVAIAHRATHQAQRPGRRGRHRPLVPVRVRGGAARLRRAGPGPVGQLLGVGGAGALVAVVGDHPLPRRLPRRGRRAALRPVRSGRHPRPAQRVRAREGALRASLRPEPPARLGADPPARHRLGARRHAMNRHAMNRHAMSWHERGPR